MTPQKKDIFAGLFLGLLIGIMVGLSISQVTGIIIGSLASLLAAFFGLKNESNARQLLIGTFSLFCILGIFSGIYLRNTNALSPSIEDRIESFKTVDFSEKEIKQIILASEFGILSEGMTANDNTTVSTVLMSGEDEDCAICLISDDSSLGAIQDYYIESGKEYSDFMLKLKEMDLGDAELRAILLAAKNIICKD